MATPNRFFLNGFPTTKQKKKASLAHSSGDVYVEKRGSIVWLVMILTLSLYFFSCMNIGIANEVGEGSHVQGE